MKKLIEEIFNLPVLVIQTFKNLLLNFLPKEPKEDRLASIFPVTKALCECLNLGYDDTEMFYIAKYIYRYRGSVKSVEELARFLNIKINLENYPSGNMSSGVKITVTADANLDDSTLLIELLKKQIPDLLFIGDVTYEIELQIIRLNNLISQYEFNSVFLSGYSYIGGRDDILQNSNLFKYRIAD